MMDVKIALPVLISFAISAAAGPIVIPILRKLKVGQTVRDDGPQTHLKKNGITLSRRTVSKYREQLRIPCQRERRKYQ